MTKEEQELWIEEKIRDNVDTYRIKNSLFLSSLLNKHPEIVFQTLIATDDLVDYIWRKVSRI